MFPLFILILPSISFSIFPSLPASFFCFRPRVLNTLKEKALLRCHTQTLKKRRQKEKYLVGRRSLKGKKTIKKSEKEKERKFNGESPSATTLEKIPREFINLILWFVLMFFFKCQHYLIYFLHL